MKKELHLSEALALPLGYATSRNMVLGQSGSGKSNACVVLAEEMHRVKIPWVAIDTKGDWYGIRSNRSGKQRGLDIPVFGGEFGDMPLSPRAGTRMAELVAAGKFAGVLDVSDFPKLSDTSQFLTDFSQTLLKKNRTPVHLYLEECADYLPQGGFRGQMDPYAAACVGAMKRLATKCRFRGIGYTLISQRAAEVNKTVLYQCETLIAFRMVGDLDVDWIGKWVKRSSKRAPELLNTIPDLRDGECRVWSPQRLKIIERVQARRRETFDSGRTPEIGEARVVPKMAPVELNALRKELADLEEQEKANDPAMLKRKIVDLQKELAKKAVAPKAVEVQVPVKLDWGFLSNRIWATLEAESEVFKKKLPGLISRWSEEAMRVSLKDGTAPKRGKVTVWSEAHTDIESAIKTLSRPGAPRVVVVDPGAPKKSRPSVIGGGLRRMLIALAQRPQGLTNAQLGVRAGLSSKSGTFSTYLSNGRKEGWIRDEGPLRQITEEGLAHLGDFTPLPEGRDLLEYWRGELGGGLSRMLDALAQDYPKTLTNEELGEAAGISHKSGTFSTYLSKLRKLELVEGRSGALKMSEEMA